MRKAVVNAVLFPALAVVLALAVFYFVRRRRRRRGGRSVLPSYGAGARTDRLQAPGGSGGYVAGGEEALVRFPGGEALTVAAILEAPGEVVAKSAHSTLYRAGLSAGEAVALLRFVRPACAEEAAATARVLAAARHPNLVQHGPSLPPPALSPARYSVLCADLATTSLGASRMAATVSASPPGNRTSASSPPATYPAEPRAWVVAGARQGRGGERGRGDGRGWRRQKNKIILSFPLTNDERRWEARTESAPAQPDKRIRTGQCQDLGTANPI